MGRAIDRSGGEFISMGIFTPHPSTDVLSHVKNMHLTLTLHHAWGRYIQLQEKTTNAGEDVISPPCVSISTLHSQTPINISFLSLVCTCDAMSCRVVSWYCSKGRAFIKTNAAQMSALNLTDMLGEIKLCLSEELFKAWIADMQPPVLLRWKKTKKECKMSPSVCRDQRFLGQQGVPAARCAEEWSDAKWFFRDCLVISPRHLWTSTTLLHVRSLKNM